MKLLEQGCVCIVTGRARERGPRAASARTAGSGGRSPLGTGARGSWAPPPGPGRRWRSWAPARRGRAFLPAPTAGLSRSTSGPRLQPGPGSQGSWGRAPGQAQPDRARPASVSLRLCLCPSPARPLASSPGK